VTGKIPPHGENIRIIPLGGVEEVGKNMTVIEIGQDIIVVDAGLQFRTAETPGIDYIIPNTRYLEENKDRVRAVIITHGHLDHIGAIPYIMGKIGNPPLYTRELTSIMVLKRQEEFPHFKPLNIKMVEKDERIQVGNLNIKFFGVTHSIPDSMGILIETPYGNIVCTGDLRVDNNNGVPTEEEEESYGKLSKEKNLVLLADSTNAENPGFSLSERLVLDNIEQVIREAKGRLIIGTFASQLQRIMKILEILEKLGKKVIIEGRSMKSNIEIVQKMNMIKLQPGTIIPVDEVENYPDSKIVVIATGSQGEEFAAIMRMSNKTHKYFKVKKGDTVLLSSSIIPGNELGVQKIKDNLSRQGAKIISYRISQIHASGHANKDELAWIHRKIGAKFFIPIHGYHYMLSTHADIAKSTGTPEENIVIPDNGLVIEIREKGEKIGALKERAPASPVMVDGFSVGDVQDVVIRDRQMLAQDGMFVIIATVDSNTGRLKKSPDLISRGFVYLKENQELLQQSRLIIKKTVETAAQGQKPIDFDFVKANLTDQVSKFLFQKTAKRPLVIPVILSV
jgi:ribonuclease J